MEQASKKPHLVAKQKHPGKAPIFQRVDSIMHARAKSIESARLKSIAEKQLKSSMIESDSQCSLIRKQKDQKAKARLMKTQVNLELKHRQ